MEEQTSWKGHAFTLMIFGGIVVLCSIFFVLGMLVGRTQTVKLATVATAEAAAKPLPKEPTPENYSAKPPSFEAAPARPAPSPVPPPPAAASTPATVTINLQIAALKNQADAEKQVDDLKKRGFRAFMLNPTPDDPNPFYRVQVGASDPIEAESLKGKLEAAGYKPILKK